MKKSTFWAIVLLALAFLGVLSLLGNQMWKSMNAQIPPSSFQIPSSSNG